MPYLVLSLFSNRSHVDDTWAAATHKGIPWLTALLVTLLCLPVAVQAQTPGDFCTGPYNTTTGVCDGDLVISGTTLTSLEGFEGLTAVRGNLDIRDNVALTSIQGLENLSSIGAGLLIADNDALTSLRGLEGIKSLSLEGGLALFIGRNASLTTMRGLERLRRVRGDVTIRENPLLTDMRGLENLISIGGTGSLYIFENDAVTDLKGLGNLDVVDGSISISDNPSLKSLQGLLRLVVVNTGFSIVNNASLTNLQGLENLGSIGSRLDFPGSNFIIRHNASLTSLQGLERLARINDNLDVGFNPMLTVCDQLVPVLSNGRVGGSVSIQSNAPGGQCNSVQDIIDSATCAASVVTGFTTRGSRAVITVRNRDGLTRVAFTVLNNLTASAPNGWQATGTPNEFAPISGTRTSVFLLLDQADTQNPNAGYMANAYSVCADEPSGEKLTELDPPLFFEALPTSVDETGLLPQAFVLEGAYPNPFNPSTTIRCGLAEASAVTVTVHDMLGRRVSTLATGVQQAAGWHEVRWQADTLPSGVYLVRVAAGTTVQTSRLVLMK
ncbi:MAG: T9SS type A sorting domain-containing protein [Bacteroidota bacterium]